MRWMGWLAATGFGSCDASETGPRDGPPRDEPSITSPPVPLTLPPCGPDAVQTAPPADPRGYWFVAPIWMEVLPDVTGDGWRDAAVAFEAWPQGEGVSAVHVLLVSGPLTQSGPLFERADFALGGLPRAADLDGDGDADLWWEGCAVVGPVSASESAEVLDFPGVAIDVDGNGVAELMQVATRASGPPVYRMVRDGFPTWDQAPALVIEPSCADPEGFFALDSPYVRPPQAMPDLTGDGVPELFWGGFWYDYGPLACANAWLDATAVGTLDPVVDHVAFPSQPARPVGDQDGDGVGDAIVAGRLVAGPLVLASPVPIGTSDLGPAQPGVFRVPFDLTGDGVGDFVSSYERVLLSGGPDGGVVTGDAWSPVSEDQPGTFFYADGRGWHLALTIDASGSLMWDPVDLGAATPVERWE